MGTNDDELSRLFALLRAKQKTRGEENGVLDVMRAKYVLSVSCGNFDLAAELYWDEEVVSEKPAAEASPPFPGKLDHVPASTLKSAEVSFEPLASDEDEFDEWDKTELTKALEESLSFAESSKPQAQAPKPSAPPSKLALDPVSSPDPTPAPARAASPLQPPQPASYSGSDVFRHFQDPATFEIMADPVLCDDGFTYERSSIEQHFRTRIETERARQDRENDGNAGNNDDDCGCGANRPINLTSPLTGETVSDRLIPNRLVEQQIVQIVETVAAVGNSTLPFDMTSEELADWHTRREEKRQGDRRRAEEARQQRERDEQMAQNRREAEQRRAQEVTQGASNVPMPNQRQAIPANQYRVDRRVGYAQGLSHHDIGLALTLCNESQKVPRDYVLSQGGSDGVRCMVACCRAKLSDSLHWCSRCGRITCESCAAFQVTDYEGNDDGSLYRICGECVSQVIDIMDPEGATGQVRAYIQRVKLEPYSENLTNRAKRAQEERARVAAAAEFTPGLDALRNEISTLTQTREDLRQQIDQAAQRAQDARQDNPNTDVPSEKPQSVADLERLCGDLEREYNDAVNAETPSNEDEQLAHFEKLSELSFRLEEAQIQLMEAQSREERPGAFPATNHGNNGRNGGNGRNGSNDDTNISDLERFEEELNNLTQQYSQLLSLEVPDDEDQQAAHAQKVSEIMHQLEEAELRLVEAQSSVGDNVARRNAQSVSSAQHQALSGQSGRPTRNSNQRRRGVFGRLVDRAAAMVLGHGRTGIINDDSNGDADPELLDLLGHRDTNWPLPLGLSYPTQRMEQQFEVLQSDLQQHLPTVQRQFDGEYSEQRAALTTERDALEDEINSMRRDVDAAEASAREEEHRLQQRREERRRREEQARQERERVRRVQEEQAREERDRIEREHEATENAFKRLPGQPDNATFIGERGDIRMCRVCKAGPVVNTACRDLASHNDGGCNRCRHCGNFDADWGNWLPWDGVHGPH